MMEWLLWTIPLLVWVEKFWMSRRDIRRRKETEDLPYERTPYVPPETRP